jgi:hypothetical protein
VVLADIVHMRALVDVTAPQPPEGARRSFVAQFSQGFFGDACEFVAIEPDTADLVTVKRKLTTYAACSVRLGACV